MKTIFHALIVVFSALATLSPIYAELSICMEDGDPILLEVAPEETFYALSSRIEECFGLKCEEQAFFCVRKADPTIRTFSRLDHVPYRDYTHTLTSDEKAHISYIINTLANTSYAKLLLLKGELDRAGARVDHVHPLRHLAYIFSDESLKVGIRNIRRKSLIWKNYTAGLGNSLSEEASRDNVTLAIIQDFAANLQVDPVPLTQFAQQQQWRELIEYLVDHLPRQGNPRRYDM